jgi:hypothetical protein
MQHRHLNHQGLTLAAIDDIIDRGNLDDWLELRQAVLRDQAVLRKVQRVCAAHPSNQTAQRYYFWRHYAERHLA